MVPKCLIAFLLFTILNHGVDGSLSTGTIPSMSYLSGNDKTNRNEILAIQANYWF
jgi:hypothetical protein